MEISFGTSKLQKLCESSSRLQRKHGEACAKKVRLRLSDLRAAVSLEDFKHLGGRCHELGGDRDGQLALELADGKRLIFEPDHEDRPTVAGAGAGDGLSWPDVTAARIVEITDYH